MFYTTALLSWYLLLTLVAILRPVYAASDHGQLFTEPGASEYNLFLQLGAHAHVAELNQREDSAIIATKPHILFILLDDLGYADFGFNKDDDNSVTPAIDALAKNGVVLDRHYVHSLCSPTRSAIQSGRAPIHVNVINDSPGFYNPADPVSGYAGIPPNMTGIAEVMKSVGYSTHMVGKWDVGMATPGHTPAGKGFDTSLIYFGHKTDSWTSKFLHMCNPKEDVISDLWEHGDNIPFPGRPAKFLKNVGNCSDANQHADGGCIYIEQTFENRVKTIIRDHNTSTPLFLFWSTKTAHAYHQPPKSELAKFWFSLGRLPTGSETEALRRTAVISWIDGAIGRVLQTLKMKNIFDDTLIVLTSDNGADAQGEDFFAKNTPLKGGKGTSWEGGVRVPAVVSGGFVPSAVRGTVRNDLVAAWDWYATFAGLAGANPADLKAALAGLPPHDSIDQWPTILGDKSKALRTRIEMGSVASKFDVDTIASGLIIQPYKLLVGDPTRVDTKHAKNFNRSEVCGYTPETGCLYDVFADPSETRNLAKQQPAIFHKLLKELALVNGTTFSPKRGGDPAPFRQYQSQLCNVFVTKYDGFLGPFL